MSFIKAVIFDMDGVIIDSEPMHYQVNQRLYDKLGFNISDKEYKGFIGLSPTDKWTKIKDKYELDKSITELVDMQAQGNLDFLKNSNSEPINGIRKLLETLKNNNYHIALASSSPLKYIEAVLEKFNITDYFQAIESGENVKNGKPAPDIYLKTAGLLNIRPAYCLVVEDSENGVNAAKNAGMWCVGYDNVNSEGQDLSRADCIVKKISEINLDLIENFVK